MKEKDNVHMVNYQDRIENVFDPEIVQTLALVLDQAVMIAEYRCFSELTKYLEAMRADLEENYGHFISAEK